MKSGVGKNDSEQITHTVNEVSGFSGKTQHINTRKTIFRLGTN